MPEPLLDGIRVVDLSTGVAGPTVTMLMAEAGADVVLVEPPGGHPDRALPGFRTWARSKQSLVLDVESPEGRLRLDELLHGADVLVHSYGPTTAARLGLDDAAVGSRHPALVVSSVLAWPANHVDADRPVDDLLALARLGILDEQQGHRPGPVHVRFPLGSWGGHVAVRDRDRGPAGGTGADRPRRAGAHQPRPGRARSDDDALAPGRGAVGPARRGHAQGRGGDTTVRVRRRRVDPRHAAVPRRPAVDEAGVRRDGCRGGRRGQPAPRPGDHGQSVPELGGQRRGFPPPARGRVAGRAVVQRPAGPARAAARRGPRRRAGEGQPVRHTARRPRGRPHHRARPSGHAGPACHRPQSGPPAR